MLDEIISQDVIKVKEKCKDWKEAIHVGVKMLIDKEYVEEEYEEAIIDKLNKLGPYMAVSPNIVLSHGRPSDGAKKNAISFLTLDEPINFGSEANDPIKLIITMAALDNSQHILLLSEIVPLLRDRESLEEIFNAKDKDTILSIIKRYS